MSLTTDHPLRVAIDAQLTPGQAKGGIEQVVLGLINALGKLDDGAEEYVVITRDDEPHWLLPYLGSNQVVAMADNHRSEHWKQALGPLRQPLSSLRRYGQRLIWPTANSVSNSNGFYEGLNVDVVHFPYQSFVQTDLPMVYNPHDLQHLHFPQYFKKNTIAQREISYRTGCRIAKTVVVASNWAKADFVNRYGLDPTKVQAIPWASPTEIYSEVTDATAKEVAAKIGVFEPFALFPAATWPHKNHAKLFEAIARIRDESDLRIRLVCTGFQNEYWPEIESRLNQLSLENQVRFLGVVPGDVLRAIYKRAQFLIMPSLFEPASFPIYEAWYEGVPVACSSVAGLPEQVSDAALMFDPNFVDSIAKALRRMASDARLRADLRDRGIARSNIFRWETAARAYRAVYRDAAGRTLTQEDRRVLASD